MSSDNHALHGLIKGRVQGVFFRAGASAQARRLGLSGWVRNTPQGHVEILIAGRQQALQRMQAWLWQGPDGARVDAVELQPCVDTGLEDFRIRY